jgi:hypothetical protein
MNDIVYFPITGGHTEPERTPVNSIQEVRDIASNHYNQDIDVLTVNIEKYGYDWERNQDIYIVLADVFGHIQIPIGYTTGMLPTP